MAAVWKDMDKVKGTTYEKVYLENSSDLLEGVYLYRNANDTYNVTRETDKGKPVAGVNDNIGYVIGDEKKGDDLGEAGGIQFEIVPCDGNNKTVGMEYFDHHQDFDFDGLTSLSEWFWSNYTFFHNGKEMIYGNLSSMEWDSDGDMLSDGWEIRYGFDPLRDNSPDKNDDDGDNDGIKDVNEYYLGNPEEKVLERIWKADNKTFRKNIICRVHDMFIWGAQPDRQDIFVEVDWMKSDTTGKEYKMSTSAKEKVALAFFKACKYGINIRLHIDDGCMGGSNDIGFDEFLAFYDDGTDDDNIDRKDGIDGNPNQVATRSVEGLWDVTYTDSSVNPYFDPDRKDIFHYCLHGNKASYIRTSGETPHGKGSQYPTKYAAPADAKGDFLVLWIGSYRTSGYDESVERASLFMHEFGHCLNLDADGMYGIKGDDYPIDDDLFPSCMRYGRDKGDNGFVDYSFKARSITVYTGSSTESVPDIHDDSPYDTNEWGRIELDFFSR